jgi:hypothetical protein
MTPRVRRLASAVGLAVAWYVLVILLLLVVSVLWGERHNTLWLWKILLFPAGLLGWLEVKLTEWFGVPGPGHLVLTKPLRTVVVIGYPLLHFGFVLSIAYLLLGWRAKIGSQGGRA